MIDFYYFEYSAPCRAVMLTAKALGISLNKTRYDLLKKEQLNPEFIAINPQHCVPTLVDGDLILWDSHVICTYLVSQYGKDDSLYPKCPKQRALVDRLLYFEGSLYKKFFKYYIPCVFKGEAPDLSALEATHESLKFFNHYYLAGHDFCVGNNLTVADFSLVATISNIIEFEIDMSKYPNITAWFERCKSKMPGYETENEGVKPYAVFVKSKIAATQS
ncbi:Glutathione S-transferase 1 [Armadillidium vulgare]|nr:Glutathione S-transferase 1 [Armadillidium vulgare]